MAGIYNGPARGGNRGGKDQFDWDNVKEDKYHQSYLGHSVKAPIGRWQNGRDLHWYAKKSKVDLNSSDQTEKRGIQSKEQDLMLQLLGEKPMEPAPRSGMDRIQKNKLLKKGDAEAGTVAAAISQDDFGERVEGIGYAPVKIDDLRQAMETSTSTRLEGTGVNALLAEHAAGEDEANCSSHADHDDHAALLAAIEGGHDPHDSTGNGELTKEQKKQRKRLEKELKKQRKAAKKEAKSFKKKSKKSMRPTQAERPSPHEPALAALLPPAAKRGRSPPSSCSSTTTPSPSPQRRALDSFHQRSSGGRRRSSSPFRPRPASGYRDFEPSRGGGSPGRRRSPSPGRHGGGGESGGGDWQRPGRGGHGGGGRPHLDSRRRSRSRSRDRRRSPPGRGASPGPARRRRSRSPG